MLFIGFAWDGQLEWYEATVLLVIYICYILLMKVSGTVMGLLELLTCRSAALSPLSQHPASSVACLVWIHVCVCHVCAYVCGVHVCVACVWRACVCVVCVMCVVCVCVMCVVCVSCVCVMCVPRCCRHHEVTPYDKDTTESSKGSVDHLPTAEGEPEGVGHVASATSEQVKVLGQGLGGGRVDLGGFAMTTFSYSNQ